MPINLSNHPRIEMAPPDALKRPARHPRKHSPKHVAQIEASIRRFGMKVPLVVDEDGVIIVGVGRWLAARSMKLDFVPIIRATFLARLTSARLPWLRIACTSSAPGTKTS